MRQLLGRRGDVGDERRSQRCDEREVDRGAQRHAKRRPHVVRLRTRVLHGNAEANEQRLLLTFEHAGEVLGSDDLTGEAGLHHPAEQAVLLLDRLGPRADLIVQLVVAHRWLARADATVRRRVRRPSPRCVCRCLRRRDARSTTPPDASCALAHSSLGVSNVTAVPVSSADVEEVGERSVCVGDH